MATLKGEGNFLWKLLWCPTGLGSRWGATTGKKQAAKQEHGPVITEQHRGAILKCPPETMATARARETAECIRVGHASMRT